MNFIKQLTILIMGWMLLGISQLKAQQYTISPLGMGEGLSCNYVVSIAQDKNGFLWFATEEGLNRFDGEQFFKYYKSRKNANSISSSELNCLLDDPRRPWLWIGTKNDGLNVFDYNTDTFTTFKHEDNHPHSIATNDITYLAPAADGNIWITTYWKGVEYLNTETGSFTHYNTKTVKGMPDDQLWCVKDLGNGIIIVGHVHTGLTIIDTHNHTAHNYRHSPTENNSIASDEVNSIFEDRNGTIWVGTSNGIDIFDHVNQKFIHVAQQELQNHKIYDIQQFSDGKIWAATEMNGVIIIDSNKKLYGACQSYPYVTIKEGSTEYSLTGNSVRCLLQDKYNNVWAGLYGSGINFLTTTHPPFSIINYSTKDAIYHLTEKSVMSITRDRNGNLWVGTDGDGINVFSPEMKHIQNYPNEVGRNVQAATTDSHGTLWFGSFNKGAFAKKEGNGFQQISINGSSDIRAFYEDRKGQMWIATSNGIYLVDILSLQVKAHFEVGNKLVRTLCLDRKGRVWVGYFGYGVEIFTPEMKKIKTFSISDAPAPYSLPSNSINQLYLDSKGQMWAGTNEGVALFDMNKLSIQKIFNKSNGLNNEHIRSLAEDKMHNIWMSTNMGISCLDSQERFYNYTNNDNVPQANFNDRSIWQTQDGIIYMGSSQGLCYFSPKYVRAQRKAPKVFITSLNVITGLEDNDSTINLTNKKEVSLSHSENTFSVKFNVQNYALGKYVEYSYLLKGIQENWLTTSSGNITLHDIPAGSYLLQIRTRIHNQEWSNDIAELQITIRPPFWLSWWAKLIYAMLIVGIAYAALRIYQRHLRLEYLLNAEKINHEKELKLNEERLRFFTNITHELRTPLTLILGPLDDISHSTEISKHIKHKLAIIHQSAQHLNELITQILEFRKTETGNKQLKVTKRNIVDAVHEISLKYEELAEKPNVSFRFVAPENPIETYFDQDVIRTVVDNLVSNAIKYTDKGYIDISVERRRETDKHLIDITISDTGHGISHEALPHIFERYYQENGKHQASGTGIGLSLVKKLVTLHEGKIKVESSLEEGTSFIFTIDEDNVYPHAIHEKEQDGHKLNNDMLYGEALLPQTQEIGKTQEKEEIDKKPILLIVEDNKDILNYIAESFSNEFDTHTALDGREGLAIALDKIPDIIISDIMMPNMDGNKMCRMLKNDIRTSHIPIILLTAKDSLEAKEEGYDSGADSYITKPFTHSLLLSRINNLLLQRKRNLQVISNTQTNDLGVKKQLLRDSLNKIDQEFFDHMNKIIEENISGDVDVNMLAAQLAMSSSTLYRKTKSLTGISTNEYIRKYKMQYAEHLLLEGIYTISEISFMVGMNSIAYFRKCFKAEYGLIPSEYLKKLKKEGSE